MIVNNNLMVIRSIRRCLKDISKFGNDFRKPCEVGKTVYEFQ